MLAALGAVPAAVVLTGCSGSADASEGTSTASARAAVKKAAIRVTPADGTRKADFAGPVEVTVTDGTLASVKVTGNDGSTLAGSLNDAKTTWTSTTNPYSGTKYTVAVTAQDGTAETATFTTKSPGETFVGWFTPEANTTSGVGMPVSLNFSHAVSDQGRRPEGDHGDRRARRWRSWATGSATPGSTSGPRRTGRPARRSRSACGLEASRAAGRLRRAVQGRHLPIGREQISTVDLPAKKMMVERDGKTITTYPVSAGDPTTPPGQRQMVISERFKETRMKATRSASAASTTSRTSRTPMRLTNSGTFVHGNYWAATSVFGSRNTSHGCVGLHDAKGANDSAVHGRMVLRRARMLGDVVIVKNSGDKTVEPANGLNGWNLSWSDWKAGSAR